MRSYIQGPKSSIPTTLSAYEINHVVSAYGTVLPREELDMAVFALDREYFERSN